MSRACKVCISEFVKGIDELLIKGFAPTAVCRQFSTGPSPYSVARHRDANHHLKLAEPAKLDSTDDYNFAVAETRAIYQEAKDCKAPRQERRAALVDYLKALAERSKALGETKTDSQRRAEEVRRGQEALANIDGSIPMDWLDRIVESVKITGTRVVSEDA